MRVAEVTRSKHVRDRPSETAAVNGGVSGSYYRSLYDLELIRVQGVEALRTIATRVVNLALVPAKTINAP